MIKIFGQYILVYEEGLVFEEGLEDKMLEEIKYCDIVCPLTTTGPHKFFLPLYKPENSITPWCFMIRKRDYKTYADCGELTPFLLYGKYGRNTKWIGVVHRYPQKKIENNITIPKIIHQIWIGGQCPYTEYMKSWQEKNPDWKYMLWNENNIDELVNQEQYFSIKEFCGKADILRYEILYRYGGIYADADLECIRPLEDTFLNNHAFFCYENEVKVPGLIANTIFGVNKHNEVMLTLIEKINSIKNINALPAWQMTGPKLVTEVLKNHPSTIYPSFYFLPQHHSGYVYKGQGKSYTEHHWYSTKK